MFNKTVIVLRDGCKLNHLYYQGRTHCPDKILFLHGGGLSASIYRTFARALAQTGPSVSLIDLRGHGESDGRRGDVDYIDQYSDDVSEVISNLQTDGSKVYLGAHSAAIGIALKCFNHPRLLYKLSGLIAISPAFIGEGSLIRRTPQEAILQRIKYISLVREALAAHEPAKSTDNDMRLNISKFLLAHCLPFCSRLRVFRILRVNKVTRDFSYTARALRSFMAIDTRNQIGKIDIPVMLVVGGKDPEVHAAGVIVALSWWLRPSTPFNRCLIEHGDHFSATFHAVRPLSRWILSSRESRSV